MDENLLIIADSLVAFSRVFATCVIEKASADWLSYSCVFFHLLSSTSNDRQTEALHDLDQLLTDILTALHRSSLDKVLVAPLILKAMHFPSFVHSKHCQVVSILVIKLGPLLVCKLLLFTRSIEHILHRKHWNNSYDLIWATKVHRRHHHLWQLRLKRKLCHQPPKLRQKTLIVKSLKVVKSFKRWYKRLSRRRVHELKIYEIINSHGLQKQYGLSQVSSLNLGHCRREHLSLVCLFCIKSKTLSWTCSSCTACTLSGRSLRYWRYLKSVHAHFWIVNFQFGETWIHHVVDAVDC